MNRDKIKKNKLLRHKKRRAEELKAAKTLSPEIYKKRNSDRHKRVKRKELIIKKASQEAKKK